MKLRRRTRIDTLQNDVRRRGNSWDRMIYFGLVAMFLGWVVNMFVGDYVSLNATGLVMRDRVAMSTQFTALVDQLDVIEGSEIKKGQVIAQLKSKEVEETLAKLSADIATATSRRTQLSIRQNVIKAMLSSAERTYHAARESTARTQQLISEQLISNKRISEMMDSEFRAGQTLTEMQAEDEGIRQDLPQLEATLAEATATRDQVRRIYNEGRIIAPVDGIVGALPVRQGSVARTGDPLMELYTGEPYVLSYVPEGALYSVHVGDPITINVGLTAYNGRIKRLFPVSAQMPAYFQDALKPPARAQVMHISFEPGQTPPTLFAKPRVTGAGGWFHALGHVLGIVS